MENFIDCNVPQIRGGGTVLGVSSFCHGFSFQVSFCFKMVRTDQERTAIEKKVWLNSFLQGHLDLFMEVRAKETLQWFLKQIKASFAYINNLILYSLLPQARARFVRRQRREGKCVETFEERNEWGKVTVLGLSHLNSGRGAGLRCLAPDPAVTGAGEILTQSVKLLLKKWGGRSVGYKLVSLSIDVPSVPVPSHFKYQPPKGSLSRVHKAQTAKHRRRTDEGIRRTESLCHTAEIITTM